MCDAPNHHRSKTALSHAEAWLEAGTFLKELRAAQLCQEIKGVSEQLFAEVFQEQSRAISVEVVHQVSLQRLRGRRRLQN